MSNCTEDCRINKLQFILFPIVLLVYFLISFFTTAQAKNLLPTPSDAEGPFYPVNRQSDEDNNLIQVNGRKNSAQGDILLLTGKVVDTKGQPLPNAVVEIWQTDTKGKYKDKRDLSPGKRDPDFQYWGKAECKQDGSYSFITLVPGEYEPRPAHIHYKVWVNGIVRLTSQIYFMEKRGQVDDRFLQHVTPNLQSVDLRKIEDGRFSAYFMIVLPTIDN